MLATALVILLLLSVNAVYVAAEFAVVGARSHRVGELAQRGSRAARRLLLVIENPDDLDRFISACQLGITISSLVLGAFGQATLARALGPALAGLGGMAEFTAHSVAAVVVLVGLACVQLVFSEQIPKSLALHRPDRIASATVRFVLATACALSWFVRVLNGTARAVLFVLRAPSIAPQHLHSAEEIDLLLADSSTETLALGDRQRLRMALQLGERTARRIMVPRQSIEAVEVSSALEQVLQQALSSPFTRLPVYEETIDRILGMLHTRDLLPLFLGREEGGMEAGIGPLIRPVVFVPESMTADRIITAMRESKLKLAIVRDEFGGTAGLLTLEDLLAEVLGDVKDEHSLEEERPQLLGDGRVRLPGLLRLEELEDWIGTTWQGEAATVGGLVTELLGHLPECGESLTIGGARVEVERVSKKVVKSVIVRPSELQEPPESGDRAEDRHG